MSLDFAIFQQQFEGIRKGGGTPTLVTISPDDLESLMRSFIPEYKKPEGLSVNNLPFYGENGQVARQVPIWLDVTMQAGTFGIQWIEE